MVKVDSEEDCKVSDLLKSMQAAYDRIKKEAAAGVYGQRYVPASGSEDDDDPDTRPDFPYVTDPKGYTTHVPLEQDDIKEADEPAMPAPAEAGADAGEDAGAEMPASPGGDEGGIGDMGMDASGDMPGVDSSMPGMAGMGEQKEELSSTQIGRVYELKKIYSRLASVESFLARTTDESILEIRKLVAQSIDLFELVISNYDQYKEQVDEIIVTYYEFLDSVYTTMKNYFAEMSKE